MSFTSPVFSWFKKNLMWSSSIFSILFFSFASKIFLVSNNSLFLLILSFIKSTFSPLSNATSKLSILFSAVFICCSYALISKVLLFSCWHFSYTCFAIMIIFSSFKISLHLLITAFSITSLLTFFLVHLCSSFLHLQV